MVNEELDAARMHVIFEDKANAIFQGHDAKNRGEFPPITRGEAAWVLQQMRLHTGPTVKTVKKPG